MDLNLYLQHNQACLLGPVQTAFTERGHCCGQGEGRAGGLLVLAEETRGSSPKALQGDWLVCAYQLRPRCSSFGDKHRKKILLGSWLERRALKQEQRLVGQGLESPTASEPQMKL